MKQILENLIKDWWLRSLPKVIPREINLEDFVNLKVRKAVAVVGFRRTGKTYLLLELAKKLGQRNCLYINFEDERLPKETKVLTNLLEVVAEIGGKRPYFLLLDEIQNIENWSLWLRRVLETTNHQIFITGSSSKLSSSQIPTYLRGRSLSVFLNPLTFKEFLRFKEQDISFLPKAYILNLAREYLQFGGFPEIVLVDEGKKPLILDEYFQTFLWRDIKERYHLRNTQAIKTIIQMLLNSSYFTLSRLTNNVNSLGLKVGKSTLMRYLSFLEESFFFQPLYLHTPNIKNRLKAEKKPYFVDAYFLSRYSNAFSQNFGRLMENIVANRLINLTKIDPNFSLYYFKDFQNHEVDFILREKEEVKAAFQISFITKEELINPREIKSLIKVAKIFGVKNLKIITWDLEKETVAKGEKIICQPFYKWMMEEIISD